METRQTNKKKSGAKACQEKRTIQNLDKIINGLIRLEIFLWRSVSMFFKG
jgi:hypothetical protein